MTAELEYVQTFRDAETIIHTEGGISQYWQPISHAITGHFELGLARHTPGSAGPLTPEAAAATDSARALAGVVAEGQVSVSGERGAVHTLGRYDFVYVPSGDNPTLKNVGEEDAWVVWSSVPVGEDQHDATMRILNPFQDVESKVGAGEDDIKTYWIPIADDTVGASDFTMGLIRRPPGTEVPLHRHDPPETREAFIVLDGLMGVQGQEGNYYELDDYDTLYVPQHGQHSNRNVSSDPLWYVFIESPNEPELEFL